VSVCPRRGTLAGSHSLAASPSKQLEHTESSPKSRSQTPVEDDPGKVRYDGKTCHLCDDSDGGPCYDLWHVLFECSATTDRPEIVALRTSSGDFLLQICTAVLDAVEHNSQSMSNTAHAGVSHDAILAAVQLVRDAVPGYDWDCKCIRYCWHCHFLPK
jgi:hypothetical protein